MNEKVALLGTIYEMRNDIAMRAASEYLGVRIDELRAENDTLDSEEIKRNQGGIRELKLLHSYITKGLPSFKKGLD